MGRWEGVLFSSVWIRSGHLYYIVSILESTINPDMPRCFSHDLKIHVFRIEFNCLSSDIIFCAGLYPHSKLQKFKQRAHDVVIKCRMTLR